MTCTVCHFRTPADTTRCPRCHFPCDDRQTAPVGEDDRVTFDLPELADETDTAQPLTLASDTRPLPQPTPEL